MLLSYKLNFHQNEHKTYKKKRRKKQTKFGNLLKPIKLEKKEEIKLSNFMLFKNIIIILFYKCDYWEIN